MATFAVMELKYSLIVPVYNRPEEIQELLQSIEMQDFKGDFEVIIVEDGSEISSEEIVKKFAQRLPITYLFKENSGPGASRNYAMQRAQGNYFIVLDSDCLLPPHYLSAVNDFLGQNYVDCFGGADAQTPYFSPIQKAINYVMTSFFTTGGIRGSQKSLTRFEPRSFNMGISQKAFERSGGFGNIHPGEDPDLTFRLWKLGFSTAFIPEAFVYHKRRISWEKFFLQVNKFGKTRAILNLWHPEFRKLIHWLPTFFVLGGFFSVMLCFFRIYYGIYLYFAYFLLLFADSARKNHSLRIGLMSVYAVCLQFFAYAKGFTLAWFRIKTSTKPPQKLFPNLFFNSN